MNSNCQRYEQICKDFCYLGPVKALFLCLSKIKFKTKEETDKKSYSTRHVVRLLPPVIKVKVAVAIVALVEEDDI